LPYEIARERSPRNGDVYFSIRNCLDEIRGRILLVEIAEDAETDEIANDAPAGECVNRGKTVVLFTENVYADLQGAEARIIEGGDMQAAVASRDENIGGAIIGARCIGFIKTCWYPHHNVANAVVQGLIEESFALREPEIGYLHVEVFADKRGKLIFEPLLLVIGVGKIVGIGADPEVCRSETWKTGRPHHESKNAFNN
jgi:hypothetical protein